MKRKAILDFLEFRKQFSVMEWHEINAAVQSKLKEKADKLTLDDLDICEIAKKLTRSLPE